MIPNPSPLLPLEAYQETFRAGTLHLADHVQTLETAGRSTRAAQAALDSSLKTLNGLGEYNKTWIEGNIPSQYRQGWNQAFGPGLSATAEALRGAYGAPAFAMMHKEAIEVLAYGMKDRVDLALSQVGRQMADHFREVGMSEALKRQFTGETIRQTTKSMVGQLQGLGLTQFTDKAGRKYSLDAYCTMVARTTTREATTQGTLLRAHRLGYTLIHLSEHYPTCGLCAELEGRVYTTDENNKDYPLWSDDYCPVHPNCLHTISVYIDKYDPDKAKTLEKSNRPMGDQRSQANKDAYNKIQGANSKRNDLRNQYSRYVSRLGVEKTGSIQSFARSKAAGSARYQELQAAYRAAGEKMKPGSIPWSPTMTKAQAELWAKNSVVKDSYYHVTDAGGAIRQQGFRLDVPIKNGRALGDGVYVGTDDVVKWAEREKLVGSSTNVLELKINATNLASYQDLADGTHSIFKGSFRGEPLADILKTKGSFEPGQGTLNTLRQKYFSELTRSEGHAAVLQELGVQGVYYGTSPTAIYSEYGMVIFDPKRIVVVQ